MSLIIYARKILPLIPLLLLGVNFTSPSQISSAKPFVPNYQKKIRKTQINLLSSSTTCRCDFLPSSNRRSKIDRRFRKFVENTVRAPPIPKKRRARRRRRRRRARVQQEERAGSSGRRFSRTATPARERRNAARDIPDGRRESFRENFGSFRCFAEQLKEDAKKWRLCK